MCRHLLVLLLAFGTSSLCLNLNAQSRDWADVEAIPLGSRLVVSTSYPQRCQLQTVSDDGLTCRGSGSSLPIPRNVIRQIRLDAPEYLSGAGALLGGAAGLAFGFGVTQHMAQGRAAVIVTAAGLGSAYGAIYGARLRKRPQILYEAPYPAPPWP